MTLQKIVIAYVLSILIVPAFSQTQLSSNIEAVTVYQSGSKITRTARAQLKKGENILHLWDVEEIRYSNSINIQLIDNQVDITNTTHKVTYLDQPKKEAALQQLLKQQQQNQDSLNWLKEEIYVATASEKLLNENRKLGSANQALNTTDIEPLANTYKRNLLAIRKELFELNKQKQTLETRKRALDNEIRLQRNQQAQRVHYIEIRLLSAVDKTVPFRISFLTHQGSWKAIYDIKSMEVGAPLTVNYRASIKNNTGKNWEKISLDLSTATPTYDQSQPDFEPLFTRFPRYQTDTIATFDPEAYEESVSIVKTLEQGYEEAVEVERNPVSFAFKVTEKQTIAGDGQEQIVTIKKFNMPANYVYWTYPRQKEKVYLLANVIDYGTYDFVPGVASIFFNNAFIGRTELKNQTTSDTLKLSLGIAQNIIVERKKQDFSATKFIGNSVKKTFSYDIKLRNNQTQTVDLLVLDQIPISTDKAIEIELLKNSKGQLNPKNGKMTWSMSLKPNASKTIEFAYQIKSPKERELIHTRN